MGCDRHFLNLHWEHHTWRQTVTLAEVMHSRETTMWGGSATIPYVRCEKHEVCEVCGKTRDTVACLCDPEVGEHCAIRLDFLAHARPTPE